MGEGEGYRHAGVSRYITGLLVHLGEVDPFGKYDIFLPARSTLSLPFLQHRSHLPTHKPWARILWEQLSLPWTVRASGLALLHSPVNIQPLMLPCLGVITVMDLSFRVYPETFKPLQRTYQTVFTRLSAHRAERVIAISAQTARDLTNWFAIPPGKITVVFPGVDSAFHPIQGSSVLDDFRRRRGLPQQFILFVGTLEPRKNLVMLVRAFAEFKKQAGTAHKLVLAGGKGWFYQPLLGIIAELGLESDVLLPGFVPEDELPLWYNSADVFAYPSLYEGFGLPALEAMACGKPVVVADSSSLPEVVGDAGVRLNPHDAEAWTTTLVRLCSDGELRADLGARALMRAQQFSWANMTQQTVQVYRDVLSGGA